MEHNWRARRLPRACCCRGRWRGAAARVDSAGGRAAAPHAPAAEAQGVRWPARTEIMGVPLPRKHPTVATRASLDLPRRYASGLRVVIVTLGLALARVVAGGLTAILFVAAFNLLTTGHIPVDVAIVVAPGVIGG